MARDVLENRGVVAQPDRTWVETVSGDQQRGLVGGARTVVPEDEFDRSAAARQQIPLAHLTGEQASHVVVG